MPADESYPKLVAFHFSEFGEHSTTYAVVMGPLELRKRLDIEAAENATARSRYKSWSEVDWTKLSFNQFPLPISEFIKLLKGRV